MKVRNVIVNYPTKENYEAVEKIYISKLVDILLRKLKTKEEIEAFCEAFSREDISF
nr:MAG TPA: hypothetical protein [Caudoviricetes sp.]